MEGTHLRPKDVLKGPPLAKKFHTEVSKMAVAVSKFGKTCDTRVAV